MTSRARDAATIAFVVVLSALPYLGRTALESDDWTFAAIARSVHPASFGALFTALESQDHTLRPVQFASLAMLLGLGHGSATVDSFVTTFAFGAVAIGLYLTLRNAGLARPYALATALVAAVAPNAATDRFWSAVPANASLLLGFASVNAGLAASRASGRRLAGFACLALGCELASGLTYEVALPLFIVVAAYYVRRSRPLALGTALVACALVVAKAIFETRATYDLHGLPVFVVRHTIAFSFVEFIELGVGLPLTAWTALRLLDAPTLAAATAVGLSCAFAVARVRDRAADRTLPPGPRAMFVWGSLAGACAYALFATDRTAYWTATGLEDRKLAAFELGFAAVVVALIATFARRVGRERGGRLVFAGLIGAYAFAATAVVEVVGASHVATARMQARELGLARLDAGRLPPEAVVLLGGCTYLGPGVVFEAPWDATAAVRYARVGARADLRADAVRVTTVAAREGIVTHVYGVDRTYAYGARLFGYDPAERRLVTLRDREAGRAFVARTRRTNRDPSCAGGNVGRGAPIFAIDRALDGVGPLDEARYRDTLARRYIL